MLPHATWLLAQRAVALFFDKRATFNCIRNFGVSMAQACATVKVSLSDPVEVKAYYRLA